MFLREIENYSVNNVKIDIFNNITFTLNAHNDDEISINMSLQKTQFNVFIPTNISYVKNLCIKDKQLFCIFSDGTEQSFGLIEDYFVNNTVALRSIFVNQDNLLLATYTDNTAGIIGKIATTDIKTDNANYIFRKISGKDEYSIRGILDKNLTEVEIPATHKGLPVTKIDNYAFYACDSLTSVVISDSVTSIGSWAFYWCNSLTSIVIPDSVTSISNDAFSRCSSLTIYCEAESKPSGWSYYWDYSNCPVVWDYNNNEITEDGYIYTIVDGVRYSIKDNQATVVEQPINITTAVIKKSITYKGRNYSVTSIGDSAFSYRDSLTSVVIPNSVTSIGAEAFSYCVSLSSIVIPNSVASIGTDAFSYCDSLTSVEMGDNVTSIGERAFYWCYSLTSIVIPKSVTSIGSWAFDDCDSLTIYCEAESKPSGWSYNWKGSNCPVVWDYNNNEITEDGYIYTIVDGIRYSIKDNQARVVEQPRNITTAVIKKSITYKGRNYSVTSIGSSAFEYCSKLTSIAIPNSVTSIGEGAFYDCSKLTSIVIPDSVTSMGYQAFYYCDLLTIYCEVAGKPSGWDIDWKNSICPVVWDCKNNDIADDGYIYTVVDSIRYSIKDNQATVVRQAKNVTTGIIKDSITYKGRNYSVKEIGDYAFHDCDSLTSVVIPNSVASIGIGAFSGCSQLTSIVIPNSVTSIGEYAFSDCSLVYNIKGGLKYLGNSTNKYLYLADTQYNFITIAEIDNNCRFIGPSAFYDCASLTSIVIPASVTSIGSSAFSYCTSLTSIVMPNSVTSIGKSAFYNCTQLASIVIPDSVTSIEYQAFYNCDSLTSIVIPNSVTSIRSWAFSGCSSLTIYCEAESQPSDWNRIWNFTNCPVVWDCKNNDIADDGYIYTVVDGIRYSIKDNQATVVGQPINITTAVIKKSITYKGRNYSVTSIGEDAFYWCKSLTSIVIPDSVTSIGEGAFEDCSKLTIYCEISEKPSGWASDWNSNRPVVWGYKG